MLLNIRKIFFHLLSKWFCYWQNLGLGFLTHTIRSIVKLTWLFVSLSSFWWRIYMEGSPRIFPKQIRDQTNYLTRLTRISTKTWKVATYWLCSMRLLPNLCWALDLLSWLHRFFHLQKSLGIGKLLTSILCLFHENLFVGWTFVHLVPVSWYWTMTFIYKNEWSQFFIVGLKGNFDLTLLGSYLKWKLIFKSSSTLICYS